MEVTLIDHMGSDLTVVNAARVSMAKESDWERIHSKSDPDMYAERLSDKDAKLISYLAVHEHWTPFAHCQITMREKVPIFVARQRFKHTVGFAYNEVSRRYVDDEPEFYVPEEWRLRADNVKQGSSERTITEAVIGRYEKSIRHEVRNLAHTCRTMYNTLLEAGVCPEQARMVLPQSMYTEYYVTGSLAAWARAYKLRSDTHAQAEIRSLAALWSDIINPLYPESWKWLTIS